MVIDLMDVTSFEEIVAKVGEAAKTAKPGEWIQGRGWHQEKWSTVPTPNVEGFPYHDALSKVSPDNPVMLEHASGHAAYANAKAMELAGVTARTPNPPGGEILKDKAGRPIGVFRETAAGLIDKALADWQAAKTPEQRAADAKRTIDLAIEEAFSKGVTSFQDAGASFETVDLYKKAAAAGQMGIRLWVMVRDSNERLRERLAKEKVVGMADNHLTVAAIKVTADGALGSRGAWLLEPYADSPASTGLNTTPMAEHRGDRGHRGGDRLRSWRFTPSATAPTARCWTSTRRRSRPIPTRRICAGASNMRSTSARPTSRASVSSA